jgi:hypothetical protein
LKVKTLHFSETSGITHLKTAPRPGTPNLLQRCFENLKSYFLSSVSFLSSCFYTYFLFASPSTCCACLCFVEMAHIGTSSSLLVELSLFYWQSSSSFTAERVLSLAKRDHVRNKEPSHVACTLLHPALFLDYQGQFSMCHWHEQFGTYAF